MVFGIDVPIVDDVVEAGGDLVEKGVDLFVDGANALADGVVSFGNAAVDFGSDAIDTAEDVGGYLVEQAGRVYRVIDDGFEGIWEDVTETVEGAAYLAEQAADELAETAEDIGEAAVDTAVAVAETAVDAGMWTWEAANYAQDKFNQFGEDLVDFGGNVAGEVLHPVLDPILGENTVDDLIEAGVDFGRIYATGGEAGVRDFVNQQVAAEAASAERQLVTEVLGERAGVDTEVVVHYGLLRGQGMDPLTAAQAVGLDPQSDALDMIETGTRELIGDDGAAAARDFARDLMATYGQQASDLSNRTGLEQYGDRFDPSNPGAAMTPHDPGWTATAGQVNQLTQSGEHFAGEAAEAFFEPIVGQDAAEAIGEYGPRVGMEVIRAVASGGLSGGELALTAGHTAFQVATGEEFESFIGDRISTEFAGTLGEDGAALLGRLTESGLRVGLSYAAGHTGADAGPDQHVTDIDLDDVKDALIELGSDRFEALTGINPSDANRLYIHANSGNWDAEDTDDLLAVTRQFVPEDQRDFYDAMNALRHDDPEGAINALIHRAPQPIQDAWAQHTDSNSALNQVLGYDPNAGSSFLDQAGISDRDVNDFLHADEVARGIDPFTPSGSPPHLPADGESMFHALTQGLDVDPADPAAPLVAHAVALQDTIQLLQATGGPGAQPAIAQAQALMADLGRQVDLLHDTGPVIPSAATEFAAQQQVLHDAQQSLQQLASFGGAAAGAAQGAQALITQAQQAFVTNAGDPQAVVEAQLQALSAAMSAVQGAAMGAPPATVGAVSAFAQQTTQLLAAAQSHTSAAYGLAPPPPAPPEATQEGSLAAQQDALAHAGQMLQQLAPTAGLSAAAAQQAQALIAQAEAVTGDDPATVAATQQQLLTTAAGVLQGAAAQGFLPGQDPGAAVLSQQAAQLVSQASSYTAMAHGITPEPPDPYEVIAQQNAALQGALAGVISTNAISNPQAVAAAQQALGLVGAQQSRLGEMRQELEQAQIERATENAEALREAAAQADDPTAGAPLSDEAIAAARAQAGLDQQQHLPDDDGAAAPVHAPPTVSADLQDSMVAMHQALNQSLLQLGAQNPAMAGAAQAAQAQLATAQTQLNTALAGQGVAPDAALAAQQHAITQVLGTLGAAGPAAAPAIAQAQGLLAQSTQAQAQIHEQIAAQYGDEAATPAAGGEMTAADLQTAMAAQHQAVDVALQQMMGQGPQAAVAASQAQAALAGAQAQIAQLAAQGPGALSPDHAVENQLAAMQQAAALVAQTGGPGAAPTQLLQSLMSQTGQALQLQQAAAEAAPQDDLTVQGFARGEPVPGQPIGPDADDDFDDDIMAGHLQPEAGAGQPSDLMSRLDADGDGQIDRGILGPRVTAADPDDPFGDADWHDAQGDALLGDQVTPATAPMEPAAHLADDLPDDTPWQADAAAVPPPADDGPDALDDGGDLDGGAVPPPPDLADVDVAPVAPVEPDVPDDVPDAPPVDDTPDLPDAPEPPPEPVTHDDADWLN
jgi:hypothetical protein